jgi:hypothetical protein
MKNINQQVNNQLSNLKLSGKTYFEIDTNNNEFLHRLATLLT